MKIAFKQNLIQATYYFFIATMLVTPELSFASANFDNSSTGTESTNQNIVNSTNNTQLNVDNTNNSTNNLGFNVNSGNNKISSNTTVGSIDTGNIKVNTKVINDPGDNSTSATIIQNGNNIGSINFSNSETGSKSININSDKISGNYRITKTNNNSVTNSLNLSLNSGGNVISNNTQVGDFTTGSITINIDLINGPVESSNPPIVNPPTTNPLVNPIAQLFNIQTAQAATLTSADKITPTQNGYVPAGNAINILIMGMLLTSISIAMMLSRENKINLGRNLQK